MLFELLRPLSVSNFKFGRIHLTRVDQYAKENLISKADFEFGIPWATLPPGHTVFPEAGSNRVNIK